MQLDFVDRKTYRLSDDQYRKEKTQKDLIVLHYTAGGTASGAFRHWQSTAERVATSYIVGPDGDVYEVFSPEYWAHHLGIKGTHAHDRRSIGIEIVNWGPLRLGESGKLYSWPNNWGNPYCRIEEGEKYVDSPYRGEQYFARFPVNQEEAVADLVKGLCENFDIPHVVLESAKRGDYDMDGAAKHKGIVTHTTFRRDKLDIGPAFNWDVIRG